MRANNNGINYPNWHAELRQALVTYFDESDLKTLCFDLRIDYDDLSGNSKTEKVIDLIQYCARIDRIDELIDICSQYRPNVPWTWLKEAAKREPLVDSARYVETSSTKVAPASSTARPILKILGGFLTLLAAMAVVYYLLLFSSSNLLPIAKLLATETATPDDLDTTLSDSTEPAFRPSPTKTPVPSPTKTPIPSPTETPIPSPTETSTPNPPRTGEVEMAQLRQH